jgi:hypothetical protein
MSQNQNSFSPNIGKKSRDLASKIEILEKRTKSILEEKQKKIEDLQRLSNPNFTPKLNKCS